MVEACKSLLVRDQLSMHEVDHADIKCSVAYFMEVHTHT